MKKTAEELIELFGIDKETIQEKVIERICNQLLEHYFEDDQDCIMSMLSNEVQTRIDASLNCLADKHILPRINEMIEGITLQKTNEWGEKKGESTTFIEYLIDRAEKYMTEKVDYQGRERGKNPYQWSGSQTRITYMIHQYLHYSIETAMKAALAEANSNIIKGLEETVKMKLSEIAKKLSVKAEMKR